MHESSAKAPSAQWWQRCVDLYHQHEKWVAAAFFVGGVGYDFLTLTRVDRLADNLILLAYLVVLAGLIIATGRVRLGRPAPALCVRYQQLLPLAIQFLLGSLFSAYTVFYFASVSLSETAVFFVLLVGLLVANERLAPRLSDLSLLMAMYCFATFSFFAFFIPVCVGAVNRWTFAAGTLATAVAAGLVLLAVHGRRWGAARADLFRSGGPAAALLAALVVLHWANLIPPVPLALRFGGVYRQVERDGRVYHLTYAKPPWYRWYQKSENPFLWRAGDRVYCFASIFAPRQMQARVYHRWRRYDERRGQWQDAGRMGYGVSGGRDSGYRGFTWKENVAPGRWIVDVETDDGQLLGRLRFTIEDRGEAPLDLQVLDHR